MLTRATSLMRFRGGREKLYSIVGSIMWPMNGSPSAIEAWSVGGLEMVIQSSARHCPAEGDADLT